MHDYLDLDDEVKRKAAHLVLTVDNEYGENALSGSVVNTVWCALSAIADVDIDEVNLTEAEADEILWQLPVGSIDELERDPEISDEEEALVRRFYDASLSPQDISSLSKVDNRFSAPISPSTAQRYCAEVSSEDD